jgi:hypothetical protein
MQSARYCQILMKLKLSRQIFEKYLNNKLHENPPCESRVFPCGRTHRRVDGQKDMTKLIKLFAILRTRLKKVAGIHFCFYFNVEIRTILERRGSVVTTPQYDS